MTVISFTISLFPRTLSSFFNTPPTTHRLSRRICIATRCDPDDWFLTVITTRCGTPFVIVVG